MIDPKVVEAFHMMWDSFPATVRLIHRDKTVIAVNATARQRGFQPGVPCYQVGTPEQHRGCRAPEALATGEGIQQLNPEEDTLRYWLPVKGCPDIYVHFPIKIKEILGN